MATEKLRSVSETYPYRALNLGYLAGLRGDEAECRKYLESAEKEDPLVSADLMVNDSDSVDSFASVRDKPWFQELFARLKAKAR